MESLSCHIGLYFEWTVLTVTASSIRVQHSHTTLIHRKVDTLVQNLTVLVLGSPAPTSCVTFFPFNLLKEKCIGLGAACQILTP